MLILLVSSIVLPVLFLCTLPLWKPSFDSPIKGDYALEDVASGIKVARFKYLAMFDWDFPDDGHKTEDCITITKHEDVLVLLEEYLAKHPEASFILEKTPGGVRGWYGQKITIKSWVRIAQEINCDPLYIKLTRLKKSWGCRVTPKPNRANDYVSEPWCVVGQQPTKYVLDQYNTYRSLIIR